MDENLLDFSKKQVLELTPQESQFMFSPEAWTAILTEMYLDRGGKIGKNDQEELNEFLRQQREGLGSGSHGF